MPLLLEAWHSIAVLTRRESWASLILPGVEFLLCTVEALPLVWLDQAIATQLVPFWTMNG